MANIEKSEAPSVNEIKAFLNSISFSFPKGFVEFYEQSNGAEINSEKAYTVLWPITEMIQHNKDYDIETYAPEFFIFGSDGGGTAFTIEKVTGKIFEMPFIGMGKEEATFIASSFDEFMKSR